VSAPWHGHLPRGWTSEPLKRLTAGGFRNGTWGYEPGESDHDVKCVRAADFDRTGLRVDPSMMPVRSVTAAEWRNRTLRPGDIVLEKSGGGDQQPVGKAVLFSLGDDAVCSNFQASARPARGVDSRYLTYALETMYQTGVATCCIKQTTGLQNLDSGAYLTTATPRPPRRVQTVIADYLDSETSRIDFLIDRKQRFIDLLLEKRTALIAHAVTKGVNPTAEMKNSGIEWIGAVPAHWDVLPLKRVSRIRYGLAEPPAELAGGVPMIRATNVFTGRISEIDMKYVDPGAVPTGRNAWLRAGEIIVVRSGACTGDSAIVPSNYDGAVAGFDMVVSAEGAHPDYLAWVLLSDPIVKAQIEPARVRAAQPHLNAEELGSCLIAMPPRSEQEAVAALLDQSTSEIDVLIDKTRQSTDLLREYRTALISAAVIGQIDIPGAETSEDVA
jgi:type I restriction enzyme, S subunit